VNRLVATVAIVALGSLTVGAARLADARDAVAHAPAISALDLIELQIGISVLDTTYYRPLSPATLAGGARTGVGAYLVGRGLGALPLPYVPHHVDRYDAADYVDRLVLGALERGGRHVTADGLVRAAISGEASAARDPYTLLFQPPALAKFKSYLEGTAFGGIGATLVVPPGGAGAQVASVVAGGPAANAGIEPADTIVAIDGRSIAGLAPESVAALLRGKIGSRLRVGVRSGGSPELRVLALVRAKVVPPLVTERGLGADVGYVALTRFGDGAAKQLRVALAGLVAGGARGIVFDLRGNGGGYGDEARIVASLFIASGPIFTIEARGAAPRPQRATGDVAFTGPLAVLVDGDTASAAEIVAGAIQDDHRGAVVGTKTFGKGVVQSLVPLPDGAALKVTTARYALPSGREIDRAGIMPNAVVIEPPGSVAGDIARDPQLARAVELVRRALEPGRAARPAP